MCFFKYCHLRNRDRHFFHFCLCFWIVLLASLVSTGISNFVCFFPVIYLFLQIKTNHIKQETFVARKYCTSWKIKTPGMRCAKSEGKSKGGVSLRILALQTLVISVSEMCAFEAFWSGLTREPELLRFSYLLSKPKLFPHSPSLGIHVSVWWHQCASLLGAQKMITGVTCWFAMVHHVTVWKDHKQSSSITLPSACRTGAEPAQER